MFLLDTNVVSETYRPHPASAVIAWIDSVPQEHQFFSVISLAEITRGARRHADATQRERLQFWIDHGLREWLDVGILPISKATAEIAGQIAGDRDREGRPISFADSLIAATAIDYRFTLVTRNIRDFEGLPLQLLNPWMETTPRHA